MIIIGIDPGVITGFAKWDYTDHSLLEVSSGPIHKVMRRFIEGEALYQLSLVIYEDAHLRTWFGMKGREALQGAGSIKRDCKIWQDFLTDAGIPFVGLPPRAGRTKLSARNFSVYTEWNKTTNEHSRDAAMLVYGYTTAMVESHLRNLKTINSPPELRRRSRSRP